MCITMITSYTIKKQSGTIVTRQEVAKGCASSDYNCQSLCRVQPGHDCLVSPAKLLPVKKRKRLKKKKFKKFQRKKDLFRFKMDI